MQLELTLDCNDLERVGAFWAQALGYASTPTVPGRYLSLTPIHGVGPVLTLQAVDEPKRAKNRMHLDVLVPDPDAELDRLLALGATRIGPRREQFGTRWYVLADAEGNEFCLGTEPPAPDQPEPSTG